MTVLSAALLLFLILDPLGNIPIVLSLLKPLPPRRRRIVLARELLIALGVLLGFLWGGIHVLQLMHLRQANHSARFWNLVGLLVPDYKALRSTLHQEGHRFTLD